MNRTIEYKITALDAGIRIDTFLRQKGYSYQNLTDIKKMPKSILVNGIHYYMRQTLSEGDLLQVCITETQSSEKIPPIPLPLDIVYEDEDILVINKPAGMPIHPSMKNYTNTLANGLAYYFEQQNKPFIFRCNNRLDRDTSGLTLISKHLVSGNILSSMVSRREIHREYLAIVEGHVMPLSGTIDAPIARKPDSIMERIVDFEHGERAVTHYQVVSYSPSYTLVSLRLETGRTHQIRVHMKYLGYPLIGDFLYNPNTKDISRQALHSHKLSFSHPITGEEMSFIAPLPDDMAQIVCTNQ
jgi:23S rRNA pseudouridine1911/1915/1917 synthase